MEWRRENQVEKYINNPRQYIHKHDQGTTFVKELNLLMYMFWNESIIFLEIIIHVLGTKQSQCRSNVIDDLHIFFLSRSPQLPRHDTTDDTDDSTGYVWLLWSDRRPIQQLEKSTPQPQYLITSSSHLHSIFVLNFYFLFPLPYLVFLYIFLNTAVMNDEFPLKKKLKKLQ